MSNELKRVQERLWKKSESVELSAEKVELALADDVKKSLDELTQLNKDITTATKKIESARATAEKAAAVVDEADDFMAGVVASGRAIKKRAADSLIAAEKAVKELGIPVTSMPNYSAASKLYDSIDDSLTGLENMEVPTINI